jgi:hypothetical protein
MPDISIDDATKKYNQFMDERKGYIDAARESARSFDQAALAFGSAVFAASVAFIKDVAPRPQPSSLWWLGISWLLFSLGLLSVMLSFLFSHKACMTEIDIGTDALVNQNFKQPENKWSFRTTLCNYLCVTFLFVGLLSWLVFALQNLTTGGTAMNNPPTPPQPETVKKGYTPPRLPPPPPPSTAPLSTPPPPAQQK